MTILSTENDCNIKPDWPEYLGLPIKFFVQLKLLLSQTWLARITQLTNQIILTVETFEMFNLIGQNHLANQSNVSYNCWNNCNVNLIFQNQSASQSINGSATLNFSFPSTYEVQRQSHYPDTNRPVEMLSLEKRQGNYHLFQRWVWFDLADNWTLISRTARGSSLHFAASSPFQWSHDF